MTHTDDTPLTKDEAQRAAVLFSQIQPMIGLVTSQLEADDLDLMERSLNELEESMRPRQVLAEMFGRTAFNQTDQNIHAKMPALRQFITLCREVARIEGQSQLHVYGEDIFGK